MVKQPFPDGKFQPPVVKQRVPHAKFSLVKRHVYVAVVKGPVPDDKFHLPVVKRISYGKFPVTRFVTVCVYSGAWFASSIIASLPIMNLHSRPGISSGANFI